MEAISVSSQTSSKHNFNVDERTSHRGIYAQEAYPRHYVRPYEASGTSIEECEEGRS